MKTIDDLVTLVRDELGLLVTSADADRPLDEVAGWDSVHMLWLVTTLERRTGRSVPMADLLEARSLGDIHRLAVRS